jgi:FtsP/CotA-like multicopper oxidase with cupredoxin domain
MVTKVAMALLVVGLLVGSSLGAYAENPQIFNKLMPSTATPHVPVTKHYTLVIEAANIQVAPNATWHAWTYNGTVPGPTLHVSVGDELVVRVINTLNLTHSFHLHFYGYNFSEDGSPANTITGVGTAAMIPPGGEYTYSFNATDAGIFEYHCHSADTFPVMYHMMQGLYGVVVVDNVVNPPKLDHDWTVVMGEMGPDVSGSGAPPYIMDGMGFSGGESGLVTLFQQGGLPAIEAQMNKTLLTFVMKVGQTARFNLANLGDVTHVFHIHDMKLVSEWVNPGKAYVDQDVPLESNTADSILVTPTQTGMWLMHCHVLSHEDTSMLGVLIVTNATGGGVFKVQNLSTTTTSSTTISKTSTAQSTPSGSVQVSILSGSGTSIPPPNAAALGFSPSSITVVIGVNNTVIWTNNDDKPPAESEHTVTAIDGSFDSGGIFPGDSYSHTFTIPGTYYYHCALHPWMKGTVIVKSH